ncbi:hypothetical protein AAG906_026997 [Vitis piasezkii]
MVSEQDRLTSLSRSSFPFHGCRTLLHSSPFNTLIHMVTIKLSSSNYLLWKKLIDYVDETIEIPPHLTIENSQTPNIKHVAWKHTNQRLLSLLLSSLTEEAMAEVVGLSTSCECGLPWKTHSATTPKPVKSRPSAINSMQLDDPSMALTKCTGFSEVWARNSRASPRPKWPSPF